MILDLSMVYFKIMTRIHSSDYYQQYSSDKNLRVFFGYCVQNRIDEYLEVPFDSRASLKRFGEVDISQKKNE
jgi:hypothetical protein